MSKRRRVPGTFPTGSGNQYLAVKRVLDKSHLSPSTRWVALAITDLLEGRLKAMFAMTSISKRSGYSREKIKKEVKLLTEGGPAEGILWDKDTLRWRDVKIKVRPLFEKSHAFSEEGKPTNVYKLILMPEIPLTKLVA